MNGSASQSRVKYRGLHCTLCLRAPTLVVKKMEAEVMSQSRSDADPDYEALRSDAAPSLDNLIRWERIKLREAAQEAVRLLEGGAVPTREYLDYMFNSDIGMRELRARMGKHRERLQELEAIKAASEMTI